MSDDLVIRGARVLSPADGVDRIADVAIVGGVLRSIGDAGEAGGRTIDASGWILAPGFVDLHAHLREPGFEHKGTIATETLAAARGGFTTVCAMPNTEPPPDSAPVLESLLERIAADAAVRAVPIGCVSRHRAGRELAELTELANAGCVAFSDDGSPVADGQLMRRALTITGSLGLPLSEHCDDPALNGRGVMNEGRISERLGLAGQPAAAEVAAIARNIELASLTGAHLHIAHVTTARGVELVADAKARGLRITCEVTPSHLFLTEDAVFGEGPAPAYDTNAKINPPLRTDDDRRALVAALEAGLIDAIATDHAPHAVIDKDCEFDDAAFGISCFETAAGSILTLVARGELKLESAIRALTSGPAGAWGLGRVAPGIGRLEPGTTADLVLVDPGARWTVDPTAFASKGRNTPLGGVELTGQVMLTIARGRVVHDAAAVPA